MEQVTFNDVPKVLQLMYQEILDLRQEVRELRDEKPKSFRDVMDIKEASEFTGMTEGAIRMQVWSGKMKSIQKGKGMKHLFSKSYLEKWMLGDLPEEEIDVTEHVIIKSLNK